MLVKDAIKMLQQCKEPDDEIIFAYWDKDAFGNVDDELWSAVCSSEHKIDWGDAHDKIQSHVEYMREEDYE
jgi:hypothetical protein|tara:strand:+ start:62 stop:274 length:213 start_codon:yes stop_codon:yes gene_type:complete